MPQAMDRLEQVPSRAGGDIEDAHRLPSGVRFFDDRLQQPFKVLATLTNAAPADAVEITPIEKPAQRRHALSLVGVDVVEHDAGVEAVLPARADAAADATDSFHRCLHDGEMPAARPRQAVVFLFGVTATV